MTRSLAPQSFYRKTLAGVILLACIAAAPTVPGANQTDKKEIIRQARLASYSLRRLGLLDLSANIKPNWESVLQEQIKADPSRAEAGLKLLAGLHFAINLDQDGKVTVTHHADEAAPNERTAAGFKQIFDEMDRAVSGFFALWSPFMLTSDFPEVEGDYRLEDLGDHYRLSYKETAVSVVTEMTRDFLITNSIISAPEFRCSIKPQFTKTSQGFVLSGCESNYIPTSGAGRTTHLKVRIDYQEVSGLQLPGKLNVDGDFDGTAFAIELAFADYKLKLR